MSQLPKKKKNLTNASQQELLETSTFNRGLKVKESGRKWEGEEGEGALEPLGGQFRVVAHSNV